MLDVSLDVFRERFALIAGTCILLWFPLRAVMPFIAPHTWMDFESTELMFGGVVLFLGWSLVGGLLAALGQAAVYQITLATIEGRELGLGSALRVAFRRILSVAVMALLYQLVVGTGLMCLIVPGIFLAWKFWVAKPALILEGASMGTAIQRSFELTTGTLGRWLGVAFSRFMFVSVLSFTVSTPDDPTYRGWILNALPISGLTLDLINVFLSSIVVGTVTALSAVIETVFYVDCRVRRDGYDLDLDLDRIEARHPSTPVPAAPVSPTGPVPEGGPA